MTPCYTANKGAYKYKKIRSTLRPRCHRRA